MTEHDETTTLDADLTAAGFTYYMGEGTRPDMSEPVAGARCRAERTTGKVGPTEIRWACTIHRKHDGDHVAVGVDGEPVAAWSRGRRPAPAARAFASDPDDSLGDWEDDTPAAGARSEADEARAKLLALAGVRQVPAPADALAHPVRFYTLAVGEQFLFPETGVEYVVQSAPQALPGLAGTSIGDLYHQVQAMDVRSGRQVKVTQQGRTRVKLTVELAPVEEGDVRPLETSAESLERAHVDPWAGGWVTVRVEDMTAGMQFARTPGAPLLELDDRTQLESVRWRLTSHPLHTTRSVEMRLSSGSLVVRPKSAVEAEEDAELAATWARLTEMLDLPTAGARSAAVARLDDESAEVEAAGARSRGLDYITMIDAGDLEAGDVLVKEPLVVLEGVDRSRNGDFKLPVGQPDGSEGYMWISPGDKVAIVRAPAGAR
jgi:hypothetical protein